MVVFLLFSSIIIILFVRFLYNLIFKGYNDQRSSKGYKASWYGKDPPPIPNDGSKEDATIHPFKIDVPTEVIEDLKYRLQRTRFEDPVEDSKFHYGFNPNYLKTIVKYWESQYNWRKQEAELNKLSHFKTKIEGINVHFVHVKPSLPKESSIKVIPLMIIHGWPGSFVEFYKIIPLLTTPQSNYDFVFEVICPSIPGYGFSESPHRKGCAMADSPAGVAAYLLEKFGVGAVPGALDEEDGALTKKFTLDELLTNVMMYWVNNNFAAAARFYKENVRNVFSGRNEKVPVTVPSGVAVFPNEVLMVPKTMMSQQMTNIVSYSIMPRGGHFAALEEPQLLADDIFKFVATVESKDNFSH